jgi:hypothetical protein
MESSEGLKTFASLSSVTQITLTLVESEHTKLKIFHLLDNRSHIIQRSCVIDENMSLNFATTKKIEQCRKE